MARARALEAEDAGLALREAMLEEIAALDSVARLWPATGGAVRGETARLEKSLPRIVSKQSGSDRRVPVRSPQIQGPLDVYYYDFFTQVLGADVSHAALAKRDGGEILAYESMNFIDGKRTVSEIRDVLSGRYAPVPLSEIAEYMDLLAKAKAITWK